MMQQLGVLAEAGGLQNFTTLAQAVIQFDESMTGLDDPRAITRLARILDHVLDQAYRGEIPMALLAERLRAAIDQRTTRGRSARRG